MSNLPTPTIGKTELTTLEVKVRNGLASFVEVGTALAKIREGNGYRLRGFSTFEEYCEKEFGFTDRHGRRLIEAAQTTQKVEKVFGGAPRVESVAREFAKIVDDPDKLRKVKAKFEQKKIDVAHATAEDVAAVIAQVTGKPKPTAAKPASTKSIVEERFIINEICPHCKKSPDRFERKFDVYQCGSCGKPVKLHVLVSYGDAVISKPHTCKKCSKPLAANASFCANCGELV